MRRFELEHYPDGRILVRRRRLLRTLLRRELPKQCLQMPLALFREHLDLIGWHSPTFAEASVLNPPAWREYLNSQPTQQGIAP